MGNLQGAINDEQTTLNSQNYQDATPSKKTAYTNAVQAAKDILNQHVVLIKQKIKLLKR